MEKMIKKIEEPGDFDGLEEGTQLIKYPLTGEFTEQVDFTDNSNLLHYEVHRINKETQMLGLILPGNKIPEAGTFIGQHKVTGIDDNPLVLNKSFEEIIIEKIWWVEQ